MSAKVVVFFCVQAFLAHAISAQYFNSISPFGLTAGGINLLSHGLGLVDNGKSSGTGINSAINGGGFTVTSSSPIAPSGVSVVSEYVIEGPLSVGGQLPVLSAVGVEGQLPGGGAVGTVYSCDSVDVASAANSAAVGLSRSNGCSNGGFY